MVISTIERDKADPAKWIGMLGMKGRDLFAEDEGVSM